MAGARRRQPHKRLSLSLSTSSSLSRRMGKIVCYRASTGTRRHESGQAQRVVHRIQRWYSRPVHDRLGPAPLGIVAQPEPAHGFAPPPPITRVASRRVACCSVSCFFLAGADGSIRAKIGFCELGAGFLVMKVARGVEVEVPEAAGDAVAGVVPPPKRRRVVVAPTAAGGRTGNGVGRRARRRVQAEATAVQRLFQACRAVFRGPGTLPAPAEVDLLRAMLDRMRPEDVGLSSDHKFFRTRYAAEGTPTITHTTIYKCENFAMVILFLPPNATIPLHNHPGMTVFSKLLLGSMHIKSYDWVDPDPAVSGRSSPDDQLRLAKLVVDDVFTVPCDTSVLYPTTGGNMHRFRAIAPCAIIDILGPPYSLEEDRDCTYYNDIPYSHHSMTDGVSDLAGIGQEGRRLAWLKEIDMPRELKMCSVHYGGPPISDK